MFFIVFFDGGVRHQSGRRGHCFNTSSPLWDDPQLTAQAMRPAQTIFLTFFTAPQPICIIFQKNFFKKPGQHPKKQEAGEPPKHPRRANPRLLCADPSGPTESELASVRLKKSR